MQSFIQSKHSPGSPISARQVLQPSENLIPGVNVICFSAKSAYKSLLVLFKIKKTYKTYFLFVENFPQKYVLFIKVQ